MEQIPTETPYCALGLAARLTTLTPREVRDVVVGPPPLVRSKLIGGRRFVHLADMLKMSRLLESIAPSPLDGGGL